MKEGGGGGLNRKNTVAGYLMQDTDLTKLLYISMMVKMQIYFSNNSNDCFRNLVQMEQRQMKLSDSLTCTRYVLLKGVCIMKLQ